MVSVLAALVLFPSLQAPGPAFTTSDFDGLVGKAWKGTLTYRDYGSGKKVTIKSDLTVTKGSSDPNVWNLAFGFPEEPKANHASDIKLSADGRLLDDEAVVGRKAFHKDVVIVTEKNGQDDDKPARIRYIYVFGQTAFTMQKLVRFKGETAFTERNVYAWTSSN